MKNFRDFGITTTTKGFEGDKIKIERILNREITVHDFKISDSKYEGQRLDLQIELNNNKHVVFTASKYLRELIEKIPRTGFPFITTIVKNNDRFEFT